jgi:hypothetical protein
MDALQALKAHFDPHGIMNPGGTLGLWDSMSGNHEAEEDHEEKKAKPSGTRIRRRCAMPDRRTQKSADT